MIKRFAVLTASVFALAMLVQMPAYAQSTDQTDQSEEDWRRSKKKRSSDRNDPTRSLPGLGAGVPIPPLEPIDTLPEESQRHLQRQRAKVIAEMEIGETPEDVPYEPSEAARTDPELAAEEEEAWEVILTDMQGGSGGGEPADSGPHRVAVAGRGGGSSAGSVTRGGSSQSAADILAQLKGLQRGGPRGGGSGAGQASQGTSTQAGGGQGAGDAAASQGQGGQSQTGSPAQGAQAGQGQAGGSTDGGQQPAGQDQAGQGQSGQGQDGQGQDGQGQSGQGQDGGQDGQGDAGQGQAGEGQDGQGQDGGADGDGAQSGEQGDGGETGADGGAASPSAEPISPLERARVQGPLAPSSGAQSSASDFLKDRNATTPPAPPAEQD